ncbi:MAG TPA: DUF885 domain-containing protein [Candidatus Limnocylindrales bacterium]
MSALSDRLPVFLDEFFRLHPLEATAVGMHDHDGRWPDLTEVGRQERLAFVDRWTTELRALDEASLTSDERIDRDLLLGELDARRFAETELRDERWDPLTWVYLLGSGIFPLLGRGFASLAVRLASAAERLEGIPAVVAAAVAELEGVDGRPVSRLHTETALRQLDGVAELAEQAVAMARDGGSDGEVAALLPRLEAAADTAREAVADFERHLTETVLARAAGEGRLGSALYDAKLRHTLKGDLDRGAIEARAHREYEAVRAEMIRLARELWPTWLGDRPLPDAATAGSRAAADEAIVRAVLDAIGAVHQRPADLLDYCRAELGRIEAFVRSRDLLGLPAEPLEVTWTPVFMRAYGGAFLDPPGPLDKGQKSYFWVTPTPADWTPEQVESYLREDNDRMLRLLSIHEGIPGHYLQLAYANRCPSLVRAVFWSGVFAEGWAVYATQVMMDLGYGADDPALLLTHWKFYLRAVTNALIDIGVHAGTMTEEEAIRLMVEGGFQEASEARAKWDRARLTSTQLSTYFVGSVEFWDLEEERRRRLAAAAGDERGAAAVPAAHVVGGFGKTPGFDYRQHLEAVLAHGSPPLPLLRRAVLGD